MDGERVPVLVVGAGVTGLSAALFLAQQEVQVLLVERHEGTSIYPRARGVNGRTMELMRELGVADEIRAAGERLAPALGIYAGTSLVEVLERRGAGSWFTHRMRARGMRGHASKRSPTGPCRCTQDALEPILLRAAYERGVDVRFSTELSSFAQDAEGVTATLRDRKTARERTVRADYLVAADGARSPVRTHLGIAQSGSHTYGHQVNVLFRADLASLVRGRELSLCLVENAAVRGLIASIDNASTWVIHISYDLERGEKPEDFTPARCEGLVRSRPSLDAGPGRQALRPPRGARRRRLARCRPSRGDEVWCQSRLRADRGALRARPPRGRRAPGPPRRHRRVAIEGAGRERVAEESARADPRGLMPGSTPASGARAAT